MMDYQIQPPSRRCAATGRELKPGDRFFTALLGEADRFERQDFAPEAWPGPPSGSFGFWTGRMPAEQAVARPRFDDDALEDCFHRLADETEPGKVNFRYVVALLLIRRKRLRLERAGAEERLLVNCPRTGEQFEVVNPRLGEEEISQVQDEVFKVLGWI